MRRAALIVLAASVSIACGASGAQTGGLFAYDASAPLDVRQASVSESAGIRILELTYASPAGGRVPATLLLPGGGGRAPAVVYQHGGGDASRRDYLAEAEDLARSGLASLLVDAPFNRPPYRPWVTFTARDRAAFAQNVVDLRRGIDLLEQRPEVDAQRVALVGHSYGGLLAGILAGIEPRLDAVVVMSGPARITDFLRRKRQAWVRAGRTAKQRAARKKQLARYLARMRAVDAVEYVGRASAPILFQFGRRDELPRAWFEKFVAAAPTGNRVEWYDAGHDLCDCATHDRKAWLLERLGSG